MLNYLSDNAKFNTASTSWSSKLVQNAPPKCITSQKTVYLHQRNLLLTNSHLQPIVPEVSFTKVFIEENVVVKLHSPTFLQWRSKGRFAQDIPMTRWKKNIQLIHQGLSTNQMQFTKVSSWCYHLQQNAKRLKHRDESQAEWKFIHHSKDSSKRC